MFLAQQSQGTMFEENIYDSLEISESTDYAAPCIIEQSQVQPSPTKVLFGHQTNDNQASATTSPATN